RITARTFIDRCWSLEHNSGCVFNKFYMMHSDRDSIFKSALKSVLAYQCANDYVTLLARYCSEPVKSTWFEWQSIQGLTWLPDSEACRVRTYAVKSKPPVEKRIGCAACHWYYQQTNTEDFCNYTNATILSPDCNYYHKYMKETTLINNGELPNEIYAEGCAACIWHYENTGDVDPCDSCIGSSGVFEDCLYAADYNSTPNPDVDFAPVAPFKHMEPIVTSVSANDNTSTTTQLNFLTTFKDELTKKVASANT
ncbi:MAG: hypothetical protein ACRD5H_18395, partial [Nitrososphaerales archaeon]